ncbi:MAG: DUF5060 domain-containing protein [bacterium]
MKKLVIISAALLFLILILTNRAPERGFIAPGPGVSVKPSSAKLLYDFEDGEEGWVAESGACLASSSDHSTQGKSSLKVSVTLQDEINLKKLCHANWLGWDRLGLDILLPRNVPEGIQALLCLKDDENFWYQNIRPFRLKKGWNNLYVDISNQSHQWSSMEHFKPWSGYVAQEVKELRMKLLGKTPYSGSIYIDNIHLTKLKDTDEELPKTRLHNLRVNSSLVKQYEKFEISFDLSRVYANPFDPELIDITAYFISPSGIISSIPGFFYQPYSRKLVEGKEYVYPVGNGFWMVRFSPVEVGGYSYYLVIKDGATLKTKKYHFKSVRSESKGFVRVSSKDKQYFEFDDGSFYYPIGLNIISPWDTPYGQNYVPSLPVGKDTYAYDEYFTKLSQNKANFIRMWMAHWWLALEWNKKYGPFHGLGRYSLQNAWRMDHILEMAEEKNIYILLTINNHTQLTHHEKGWERNPYNTASGGFIASPQEYFTNLKSVDLFKNKMRYIVARWGYSPYIFAWNFWSEIDLTIGYKNNPKHQKRVREWHKKMARFVRQLDPWAHIISTHYCQHSKAVHLFDLPEIDFTHSNAWTDNDGLPDSQVMAIRQYYQAMKRFNKPIFISEFGGHWAGSPPDIMARDLHTGLWANYMCPLAASPLFWWWNFVEEENLYFHYKALAEFCAGEDRRNKNLQMKEISLVDESGYLRAQCLGNKDTAYIWIYSFLSALRIPHEERIMKNATIILEDMLEDIYVIEFWDTYKGIITDMKEIATVEGKLTVKLPDISKDMALKIKLKAK